jgi:crystallin alpha B
MDLIDFHPRRRNYFDVWQLPQSVFGPDLDDLLVPSLSLSVPRGRQLSQRSGVREVTNDGNKFVVKLDCSHFKPEEITVKTVDNNIIINGKHEEKMDKHGWVQREFTRRYELPEGCEAEKVTSALNSNGVLIIEAPKKPLEPLKGNERVVPIAMTHEPPPRALNQ